MKLRSAFIVVAVLGAFLISSPVMAEKSSWKKFNQPGPYVAVGFGGAFDFLEDIIEEEWPSELPGLDIESGWSANVRAGYRVASWIGFEAMYEGMYDLDMVVTGVGTAYSFESHSFFGNLKLIIPLWRVQPYFLFGLGAQYGKIEGPVGILATKRWDFVIRPAFGLDVSVTENWVLFAELGLPVRFADWTDIPSQLTDNVSLTAGGGLQYRF
jgi:hypothetical protein